MHRDYYQRAIDLLVESDPDIVVVCGDLIDYERCLPEVQPLLTNLKGKLGQYFVLGNHDRRLPDVEGLRKLLGGWVHDLGVRSCTVSSQGTTIHLIGNERPWFDLPSRSEDEKATHSDRQSASLRIGVAHTPDQFPWAKDLELDLLFCGHNHGGQVRIPLIGPIIAPSWFGSRFASGWFHEKPTLLHVSRGVSGTQPLRVRCAPEVNVIQLRSSKVS